MSQQEKHPMVLIKRMKTVPPSPSSTASGSGSRRSRPVRRLRWQSPSPKRSGDFTGAPPGFPRPHVSRRTFTEVTSNLRREAALECEAAVAPPEEQEGIGNLVSLNVFDVTCSLSLSFDNTTLVEILPGSTNFPITFSVPRGRRRQ